MGYTLRKRKETLKWQGVTTAIVVATFFCISVLPYSIYHFNNTYFDKDPQSIYFRVADCCLYLHIISNFYIYTLTISSFRQFLWERARKICPWLENSSLESSRSQADTVSVSHREVMIPGEIARLLSACQVFLPSTS